MSEQAKVLIEAEPGPRDIAWLIQLPSALGRCEQPMFLVCARRGCTGKLGWGMFEHAIRFARYMDADDMLAALRSRDVECEKFYEGAVVAYERKEP